jgi:MFS family permease
MFNKIRHHQALLILGLAESVSGVGNWITALAVFALIVFRGTGGVVESSGVLLAGLAPTLLCSPLAGWLCDRVDRKWLLIGGEVLSGLAVVGLIFVDRLELIYGLLAVQAVAGSVIMPARQAAVPALVGSDNLTRANALLQQLAAFVKIGAPMLAGAILTILAPHQAMVVDVISFGLAALILTRLPALPPPQAPAVGSREARLPVSVGGVLRQSPRLRLLFVTMFLFIVTIMAFDVLAPVFTRDILGGDESLFGLLVGLIGVGSLAAGAGLFLRKGTRDPWPDMLAALLLLGVIPAALMLASWLPDPGLARGVVIVGCLIGGVGNGILSVQVGTLLQLASPPALLGRMGGLFQSTIVAGQIVAIFVTPVLTPALVPFGLFFAVAAGAIVLLTLGAALTLRRTAPASVAEGAHLVA